MEWREFASTELAWGSYTQWCNKHRVNRPLSRPMLGKRLKEFYTAHRPTGAAITGEVDSLVYDKVERTAGTGWINQAAAIMKNRPHGYLVGSIKEARAAFTTKRDIAGECEWDIAPGEQNAEARSR